MKGAAMSIHYYGRAQEAAKRIMDLFQSGDVPAALVPMFIRRHENTPCRAWSWSNQLLVALHGHDDARGFRQWEQAGRHVRKGEKGFPILIPCHVKREENHPETGQIEPRLILVGFKHCIVFGYGQTEGVELPGSAWARQFIDALPLIEVARRWGLTVQTYNGSTRGPLGQHRFRQSIALGVENLATWAHELMHAADDRLGRLTERGQHWRSETVAELGGAILLSCIGLEKDADAGGCWEYVQAYARDAGLDPLIACQRVLKRTCDAVALILSEYDALQQPPVAEVAA